MENKYVLKTATAHIVCVNNVSESDCSVLVCV